MLTGLVLKGNQLSDMSEQADVSYVMCSLETPK